MEGEQREGGEEERGDHWRSQDFVLRGAENRGAEFERRAGSPVGNREGVSPSPAD